MREKGTKRSTEKKKKTWMRNKWVSSFLAFTARTHPVPL